MAFSMSEHMRKKTKETTAPGTSVPRGTGFSMSKYVAGTAQNPTSISGAIAERRNQFYNASRRSVNDSRYNNFTQKPNDVSDFEYSGNDLALDNTTDYNRLAELKIAADREAERNKYAVSALGGGGKSTAAKTAYETYLAEHTIPSEQKKVYTSEDSLVYQMLKDRAEAEKRQQSLPGTQRVQGLDPSQMRSLTGFADAFKSVSGTPAQDAFDDFRRRNIDYNSYLNAADFEEYSKKGAEIQNPTFEEAQGGANIFGWRPGASDVGNIVTFSRDNLDKIQERMASDDRSQFIGNALYGEMTEDQVKIYNYILAKEGKEAAQIYLDSIAETLNEEYGKKVAATVESTRGTALHPIMVAGTATSAGLDQYIGGVKQAFNEYEQPTSGIQYAGQAVREDQGAVGKFAYDVISTLSNMAPSILANYVAVGLGVPAKAAEWVAAGSIGLGSGGNAYKQALAEGRSKEEAQNVAALIGASEAALSKLLSGISAVGGLAPKKLLPKVAAIEKGLRRVAAAAGVKLGGEISEEVLQLYLEPLYKTLIYGDQYDAPTAEEVAYTALLTLFTTGLAEGGEIAKYRTKKGAAEAVRAELQGDAQSEPVGVSESRDILGQAQSENAPAASQAAQQMPAERKDAAQLLVEANRKKQEQQNVSESNTSDIDTLRNSIAESLENGTITQEKFDEAMDYIDEMESLENEDGSLLDLYNPETIEKTEVNTNGRSSISDDSSQRLASQSSGEQAGKLAESTGRDQSGQVQIQRAASRRDDVARYYEGTGQQAVSAKEYLGSDKVNKVSTVQEMPAEMVAADSELRSIEQDIRAMGLNPHFFVGDARLRNGNSIDGLIRDNEVYIRADSDIYTAMQNWDHEKAHAVLHQSPGIEATLYGKIVGKGEAARRKLHQTMKKYRDAYHGIYDVDENGNEIWDDEVQAKILQEVLADAYAGKDSFAQGVDEYSDVSREAVSQIEEQGKEVRGPPEDSFAVSIREYHTDDQKKIINEYNAAVDQDLLKYVDSVKSDPSAYAPDFHLGVSTERAVNDIKRETGVDTTGFDTIIKKTDVEHILKRHGEFGQHDQSMSDPEDIARIKYVLNNYDSMLYDGGTTKALKDSSNNPAKTVVFSKKINGTYYVVEAVADNKAKATRVISAYMTKDGAAQVADVQAPSLTPNNEPVSTPDVNVAQKNKTVNNGDNFSSSKTIQSSGTNAIESMPTKAKKFMERAEGKLQNSLAKVMGNPEKVSADTLAEISREISTEFLETGTVSDETIDRTFEKVYSSIEADIEEKHGVDAEDYRNWAERDYIAEVAKHLAEMRLVRRYAAEKAETQAKGEPEKALTKEDLPKAYTDLKAARRNADKAVARNLLTERDEQRVNQLLRGDIDLDILRPGEDNVRGITEVYNAKLEYEKIARKIRQWNAARKAELRAIADKFLETASDWKDKSSGWKYSRETMERNILDIVPDKKIAKEINDTIFKPIHDSAAASNKTKNEYRDRVRKMDLSREVAKGNTISEAAAVQLLGEAEDNIRYLQNSKFAKERDGKTLEEWQGIVKDLWEQNPKLDANKVRNAVKEFREIYDELFEQLNDARMRNGYEPINYRKGYFPHFQSEGGDSVLAQFGKSLGINTAALQLPTTINGLTHSFKPGIQWFGSAQQRMGTETTFDAVEGFDSYIEGVADVIHQTDNIQRLRAFATQIRMRTADESLRKRVQETESNPTLTEEEKRAIIEKIWAEGKYELGNLAVEVDEYTNLLAGKKSRHDRDMEQALGRKMYAIMKGLEGRVAANMVAINPGSWLTNFIPITQGAATLDSGSLLSGMWDTLKAYKQDDGFVAASSFLTNRRGSDPLVRTWAQEASAKLSSPMEHIDSFTADTLVRARYNENKRRGLSHEAAMADADSWAAGVMADRSKGAMPTLFSQTNPVTKLFTQFQLEVNNQLSYVFKDIPRETKEKGVAALAAALFKFMLGAYLYDEVYEYVLGRRPALDPLGIINDTVGDLIGYELPNLVELGVNAANGEETSFEVEKKDPYEAAESFATSVIEELPFIGSLLGGGRLPISSALPDWENLGKAVFSDSWDSEKKFATIGKELAKPATYLALPFGGGQVKKMIEGAEAVKEGGSYSVNSQGERILQYPVYNDTPGQAGINAARAMIFGKSSLPAAQEWVESGFDSFGAKQTVLYEDLKDAGATGAEAYDLIRDVEAADADIDKITTIANSSLPEKLKMIAMRNSMSDSQYERYSIARGAGVSSADFAKVLQAIAKNKAARGSKTATKADVEAALNKSSLSKKQKSAIWSAYGYKDSPW